MTKSVYSAHKGSFLHACHTFLTCQLLRTQAAKSCAHANQPQKILRARALATLALFGISFKGAGIRLSSAGMHISARSSPLPPNPRPTNHRGTHSRFHKEIITLVSCSRFTPILQPRLLVNRISLLQMTGGFQFSVPGDGNIRLLLDFSGILTITYCHPRSKTGRQAGVMTKLVRHAVSCRFVLLRWS